MKIRKTLKRGAVLGGLVVFAIFYSCYIFLPALFKGDAADPSRAMQLVAIFGYLGWVICGYVTGFLAKESGLLNAALVGLLSSLLITVYMAITYRSIELVVGALVENGIFWILSGLIMSGLGGLMWDIRTKIGVNRRHANKS